MFTATGVRHHRLAMLIPYRSQNGRVNIADLAELCHRMDNFLSRTGVQFQIFVVNQIDARLFNRGALVNAAVATLRSRGFAGGKISAAVSAEYDYLAIHDIDRFPVLTNTSGCADAIASYYTFPSPMPRVLHPTSFAGGALLLPFALFRAVNGFANAYWGWGEEDNDLFLRLRWCGLPPAHAERIDWCMEHRDCVACKRQKKQLDANILHAHERRMRQRLPHPRRYMLRDGLSTLNFTLPRDPRQMRCGPLKVVAMDVDLSAHRAEQGTGDREPGAATRTRDSK